MTDKEIKSEIKYKIELAESYRQIAGRSDNNPQQFSQTSEKLLKEAKELQKLLDESKIC